MQVTLLLGGVGGAKMAQGFYEALKGSSHHLSLIVNTGDDMEYLGLKICPDIDTNLYTLAGINEQTQGWGISQETFQVRQALKAFPVPQWFTLGDKDLATHLARKAWLSADPPLTLSQCTEKLRCALGIKAEILPMCEEEVTTTIVTAQGTWPFQKYFCERKCQDQVQSIFFRGIEKAQAPPAVLQAINKADLLVIAPSNPFVSINPILAVKGIRPAILASSAPKVAVSPIIASRAVKGPLKEMLLALGYSASASAVASLYTGLIDYFISDEKDAHLQPEITSCGCRALFKPIMLSNLPQRQKLAKEILSLAGPQN